MDVAKCPSASNNAVVTSEGKRIRLRYASTCRACGTTVAAGEQAVHFRESRQITCLPCADANSDPPAAAADSGTAGASARHRPTTRVSRTGADSSAALSRSPSGVGGRTRLQAHLELSASIRGSIRCLIDVGSLSVRVCRRLLSLLRPARQSAIVRPGPSLTAALVTRP